jgi:all-trans-retinol dehydrogenase (NAD+)
MSGKYQGQTVLVTGAARGLGRLIALDFAREGAKVAIADLRESELRSTAAELEALGAETLALPVDLRTRAACYRMVEDVRVRWGRIDVLVNNAGVVFNADVADQDDDRLQLTMDVNFMAQVWATRAVLPEMIARKSGAIVSIASGAGKVGVPAMGIYCASKFALIGFFDSLRHELRQKQAGIKVITVCPGYMATKMFVGAKVPRLTVLFNPQRTSTALMHALAGGGEELFIPWTIRGIAMLRGLLPPRLMEAALEITGMHESFYGSRTED